MNEEKTPSQKIAEGKIFSFLEANTCFTLATCEENIPYCSNCFYAYDKEKKYLCFKSDSKTMHVQQGLKNMFVAGSVTPDVPVKGKIKGIQFSGVFFQPSGEELKRTKKIYYAKFPFALVIPGNLWAIEITYIKMTDNTLGFGKKSEWKK